MASTIIRTYLDSPPYFGKSLFRNLATVKALCGPTCTWCPVRKLWGTTCTDALQDLIASRVWQPYGIEYDWNSELARAAQALREERVNAWWDAADCEAADAAEAEAAAAAQRRRTPAGWVIAGTAPKKPKAAAPAPAIARASWRKYPKEGKKKRVGVEPTEAEVAECKRLGFTEEAIAFSDTLNMLGPRGTLSNEGRVLRWCTVLSSDARYEVGERNRADYFDEAVCLDAAEKKHREWAAELNAGAKAHALS